MVNMNAVGGAPLGIGCGASDSVVKDDNFVGAWHVVKQELLYLWILVGAYGVIVDKVFFLGVGNLPEDSKRILVKTVFGLKAPNIVNVGFDGHILKIALGEAIWRRVYVVEGL